MCIRDRFYIYRNWYYLWVELSGWMGSVSNGLGADLSLPPCLSVTIGIWTLAHKSDPRAKSWGKSFGTTLWHHVQRYCFLGVLFGHAQVPSNSSSYHIRGNEMNCIGSSECMTVFTSFTLASQGRSQGDPGVPTTPPFCKPFLTKQPTTGGKNATTISWP